MAGTKRSYADFASSKEPTLTILTADGGRIPAHNEVLRLMCSSLCNSPASDTWDLSSLLIDGSPVTSRTVTAVLDIIYSTMQVLDYELDSSTKYSIREFCHMLLFADAVGCSKGFMHKLAGLLGSEVPAEIPIKPPPNSASSSEQNVHGSSASPPGAAHSTVMISLNKSHALQTAKKGTILTTCAGSVQSSTVLTPEQLHPVRLELSAQLELLMYVALKLELTNLRERVSGFLGTQLGLHNTLLDDALVYPNKLDANTQPSRATADSVTPVFSARVLAAANSSNLGRELLAKAFVQKPLGVGFGSRLFEEFDGSKEGITVSGKLKQDLLTVKAGTKVKLSFSEYGRCYIEDLDSKYTVTTTFGIVLGPRRTFFAMYE